MAAWLIGRHLRCGTTWRETREIASRHNKVTVKQRVDRLAREHPGIVDIGFSYYESETFFHRRHVSSLMSRAAEERLPATQLERIKAALDIKPWPRLW